MSGQEGTTSIWEEGEVLGCDPVCALHLRTSIHIQYVYPATGTSRFWASLCYMLGFLYSSQQGSRPSACLPCLCLLPCSACGLLSWCLFSVPSWSSRLNRGGLPFLKSFCPIFLHPGRHPGLPVSPPLCTGLALVFGPWSTAYGHIY